ncbi:hypothetical protein PPERSA_08026 [Pseudocohnilembus persalinus]|uniref:B30.2/SPRY domain-containing protein n=1 Tax=Pseudocohnilembus persalinus TaxID=266149 RepID=A0A0V0R2L2_PSEPJ|nr:hypothetical protein PPERSA_08026 [Pseudocohnilembus persalinus]|eukprot:KRX08715.1 hypothetical protein PPERSA_08026 [Pseudocohnilembus persalinus]
MDVVQNSALVEAAKNYEFIKCDKGLQHQYYQINQLCLVDKCPYQLETLCQLDLEEKLYGPHMHKQRGLKSTLIEISEMCVRNQIKYQSSELLQPVELERLFLIAKDFRKIAESANNLSEYLMEIVNGTHGIKGLENILWDIFTCQKESELKVLLKDLRKHVREQKGEIILRDYKNPKNIIEKVNLKKQQIEEEIVNMCQALKIEFQELKMRGELNRNLKGRPKDFYDTQEEFQKAYDRAQKNLEKNASSNERLGRKVTFVKSQLYGKKIQDIDTNVFQGSGGKIDLMYSAKAFSKGKYEFTMQLDQFNKKKGHLYIILLQEESKEMGGNFFSPYHCIFCQDGYDMIAYPSRTSNFAPTLTEGTNITAFVDIESNIFEIKNNQSTVYYRNQIQLQGDVWRFAIWWSENNARIRLL